LVTQITSQNIWRISQRYWVIYPRYKRY